MVIGNYCLYDDTIFGSNGASGSVMAVARINLWGGGSDPAGTQAGADAVASVDLKSRRNRDTSEPDGGTGGGGPRGWTRRARRARIRRPCGPSRR